ncbi:MAG: hypothetical protein AAGA64_11420 [Bacteroidota bacterium]
MRFIISNDDRIKKMKIDSVHSQAEYPISVGDRESSGKPIMTAYLLKEDKRKKPTTRIPKENMKGTSLTFT